MKPELQAYIDRASDPRLIPGIYNYCYRRCEKCPFTGRCLTFRSSREFKAAHPDAGVLEHLHESFQKTFELLEAWCEREGLDFERFREEADSPECAAELQRVDEATDADPLMRRARCYTTGSYRIVESLGRGGPFRNWPAAVYEAIDIISGLSGIVSAKIHRALHGLAEEDEDPEWDPIQNDWNGSAKVARLAVIESRIAWETVLDAGEAPRDSPIRAIVALLDQILTGIDERFPRAMEFVRPGFDEPDVAAGARTSLAPFEPRPRR